MRNQIKRSISFLLAIVLLFQLTACEFANTAKDSIVNTAQNVSNSVIEWYKGIDLKKFKDGWNSAVAWFGSAYTAVASSEYIADVGTAINSFKDSMNSAYDSARGVAQEAGFAAEKWVAGTFNIDAAARGSSYRAEVVGSTALGSVDVSTNFGENASLKYYQNANGSAQAQAGTLLEAYRTYKYKSSNPLSLEEYMDSHGYDAKTQDALLASVYDGQLRIIPTEQLEEARAYLNGKVNKLSAIDGDVASARTKSYQETLKNLSDRLHAPDGTESKPATYEEMQAAAELSKTGEFNPEDFGFTVSQVITPKYVIKQAVGTGLEVGLIKTIFTVGPDLVSILIEAVNSGALDKDALNDTSVEGVIAMAEGFVEGSVSRVVVTLCQEGVLGSTLKNVSPNIVAALVVLVIEGMISGYSLAKGEITADEYGSLMADKILITALAIPTAALMLAILPETKLLTLVGCFAGGIMASTGYILGKEAVLEFVDGGGFEAIIPTGDGHTIESVKTFVSNLNITEHISSLKDFAISTTTDGYIYVKGLLNK